MRETRLAKAAEAAEAAIPMKDGCSSTRRLHHPMATGLSKPIPSQVAISVQLDLPQLHVGAHSTD
ncbi:hypothetical protein QU42_17810 [Bradyrhizobium sp. UASWS1016]|nr:hypothetical protein QU41_20070 [Bradyrhizobium elkanii]OCX29552.1 hypothetical protein QU42_17810 [Bradyrhizobium sp. UASWS1016]